MSYEAPPPNEESTPPFSPIRKSPYVAEQIYRTLLSSILEGRLKPEQRLPSEQDLMRQFHAGRSSVREALRALTFGGVIDVQAGRGTYVKDVDGVSAANLIAFGQSVANRRIQSVFEMREIIEVGAVRLAALRATERDIVAMDTALRAMAQAGALSDLSAFAEADIHFHLAIVLATRNQVIVEGYKYFTGSIREAVAAANRDRSLFEASSARHQAVRDAIVLHDSDLAETALRHKLSIGRDSSHSVDTTSAVSTIPSVDSSPVDQALPSPAEHENHPTPKHKA